MCWNKAEYKLYKADYSVILDARPQMRWRFALKRAYLTSDKADYLLGLHQLKRTFQVAGL